MPKKFIRRLLPDPSLLITKPGFKWLAPLLRDPDIFHINRHSVSLSFFIGLFCAYLPVPGQMIIAALMAIWLRGNLPIAVALIWVTNPVTIPPMFFLSYKLGAWLLGTPHSGFHIRLEWAWVAEQGSAILLPLILGSLICGVILGGLGYGVIRLIWRWHVINNWEKRKLKRNRPL